LRSGFPSLFFLFSPPRRAQSFGRLGGGIPFLLFLEFSLVATLRAACHCTTAGYRRRNAAADPRSPDCRLFFFSLSFFLVFPLLSLLWLTGIAPGEIGGTRTMATTALFLSFSFLTPPPPFWRPGEAPLPPENGSGRGRKAKRLRRDETHRRSPFSLLFFSFFFPSAKVLFFLPAQRLDRDRPMSYSITAQKLAGGRGLTQAPASISLFFFDPPPLPPLLFSFAIAPGQPMRRLCKAVSQSWRKFPPLLPPGSHSFPFRVSRPSPSADKAGRKWRMPDGWPTTGSRPPCSFSFSPTSFLPSFL